jgi:hypothetical protein
VAEAVRLMLAEQQKLEGRLEKLETSSGMTVPQDELRDRIREIIKEFSQEAES